jgi:nicotinamidase-related amidase
MSALRHGPLSPAACHLCVDVQRLFAEGTDWYTPWLQRVLPRIEEIAAWAAPRNVFTAFIPPAQKEAATGNWRRFYDKWPHFTREQLDTELLDIVPALKAYAQDGHVLKKPVFGPWHSGALHRHLQEAGCDTLVISGGETDMCVLGTVLGAVDLGYRVIIADDAVCSSTDKTHDATLDMFRERYSVQVEVVSTEDILRHWPRPS